MSHMDCTRIWYGVEQAQAPVDIREIAAIRPAQALRRTRESVEPVGGTRSGDDEGGVVYALT